MNTKSLPVVKLAKAIQGRFLASHKLDRIDVTAYDLDADPGTRIGRRTPARSICVVLHYPVLDTRYVDHLVVCRYHLKPGTDLDNAATIRGVLTRIGHDLNSAYAR